MKVQIQVEQPVGIKYNDGGSGVLKEKGEPDLQKQGGVA
jgi:hypothetical protein